MLSICYLKKSFFLGIVVTDSVVLVDREQGGQHNISKQGVKVHSIFPLSMLLNMLYDLGKIEKNMVELVEKFIKENQVKSSPAAVPGKQRMQICYPLFY